MSNSALHRNPGLDVLRSLCLFLVVLQHSFLLTDAFFPQFRMLWFVSHAALDLFFTLSGFLIGGIIEKKYRESNAISLNDIFRFYKRRWYKTVPMYFLIIAICLLLSHFDIYYAKDFSWKFLVFLQNISIANFNFLPHTYSLTIEEWFYILFPLSLLGILKLKLKTNPFYLLLFLWIVMAITYRVVKHLNGVENWDSEVRKTILTRMDATIYGVVLYFIHLNIPGLIKKYRVLLVMLGILLYSICTLILKSNISLFYNDVIYYTIITFVISAILPFFIYFRLPVFFEKIFTNQSLASYSIYLVHLPFVYIIFRYIKPQTAIESLFLILIFIILTYILGTGFYKFIERPIMNLRDKNN
ncbi:acyltransferase family protein [Flavobacterium sp. 25HG05S-40]|uniref:acyltransferase family protein n=1 Tax=Flavobacterium sp. 25HG05S-40 TaxID=3458682 RepID=UPI0040443CE2